MCIVTRDLGCQCDGIMGFRNCTDKGFLCVTSKSCYWWEIRWQLECLFFVYSFVCLYCLYISFLCLFVRCTSSKCMSS